MMIYKDGRLSDGIWKNGNIVYEGELADGQAHGRANIYTQTATNMKETGKMA